MNIYKELIFVTCPVSPSLGVLWYYCSAQCGWTLCACARRAAQQIRTEGRRPLE